MRSSSRWKFSVLNQYDWFTSASDLSVYNLCLLSARSNINFTLTICQNYIALAFITNKAFVIEISLFIIRRNFPHSELILMKRSFNEISSIMHRLDLNISETVRVLCVLLLVLIVFIMFSYCDWNAFPTAWGYIPSFLKSFTQCASCHGAHLTHCSVVKSQLSQMFMYA